MDILDITSSQNTNDNNDMTAAPITQTPLAEPMSTTSTIQTKPTRHHTVTCAKAGIFKPKHRANLAHTHDLSTALFASADPKGFKMAHVQRNECLAC